MSLVPIPDKKDAAYDVQPTDLVPLSNDAGTVSKAVTPQQLLDDYLTITQSEFFSAPHRSSREVTDADLATQSGFYFTRSTAANIPTVSAGVIIVNSDPLVGRISQIWTVIDGDDPILYIRAFGNSMVWTPWRRIPTFVDVPLTATSFGLTGDMASDATHIYICISADTWRRVAISTW